ncbi:peptide deformylase [Parvularcula dongshanensis]|uniref:Peptide deformylase n=1 Tax=Parvularcula dongshanensis TaxID=1173995 RepID=A0A840I289_9PROT|nr:peptide deformylase [Parvularcula dongshanensis]MBB4658308.1 peptide deformylase [Parvularcula dongshanensis]
MTVRTILTVPDPRLREVSKPVPEVNDETRALMDDMLETMYDAPGIGLAAIQIGVPQRVIVMDLAGEGEPPQPRYFVNPVISEPSDDAVPYEEGCLSIPGYYEEICRPSRCVVSYLDYDGNEVTEEATGLFAVCIQHEMDHLEGVLFLDHLSRLKRDRIMKKIKKDALAAAS